DRGIVIDRRSEKGNHPLVDIVQTVVTEPVGESGASNRRGKSLRLGFGPHGHVSAIAVPANAYALSVDRIFACDGIDAGHDVAIVPAPEILDVRLRKRLALPV